MDGTSVLIVDDDPDIRDALRLLFELEDFEVVGEAPDGKKAIELAALHQPSFVVLDQMMPGLTGADTAPFVRAAAPDARIVAFSAILDGPPEWADAYLNKERIAEIVPFLERLVTAAEPDLHPA